MAVAAVAEQWVAPVVLAARVVVAREVAQTQPQEQRAQQTLAAARAAVALMLADHYSVAAARVVAAS
jgi:hypothetical protein